jgi:hypothetical protein
MGSDINLMVGLGGKEYSALMLAEKTMERGIRCS